MNHILKLFHSMSADVTDQTVYIQDILPQNLKDLLKEPDYDLDRILLHQIKVVSTCKKKLVKKRMDMLAAIAKECSNKDYISCGPFNGEFLNSVLKDVEKDEAEARRKVLGEQESVEMFKSAFASDMVSEDYLSVARSYRDTMTKKLRDVVEAREILLIALEVLRRSPTALSPQLNPELESFGTIYSEAKNSYDAESETLRKLTEWKKNPEMHVTDDDDDDFFSFFDEVNLADDDSSEKIHEPDAESNLAVALATCEAETQKLTNFKSTKVDCVDSEFNMLADLSSEILKQEATISEILSYLQQACNHTPTVPDAVGIEKYLVYLRIKYPKYKLKISTKGYNFSLKVMRRTKSIVSLSLLSSLLDTYQDLPEEILEVQEKLFQLSNAVKRICSLHGRCSMSFLAVLNKENELKTKIQESSKVSYAKSLRVSDNFNANMKELKRLNELKDEIKQTVDNILKEVTKIAT